MATTTARAIICTSEAPGQEAGANWSLEDIQVRQPKSGELLVRLVATGVCHTDLVIGGVPDGYAGVKFPKILGHEGIVQDHHIYSTFKYLINAIFRFRIHRGHRSRLP